MHYFTILGKLNNGCASQTTYSYNVSLCTGMDKISEFHIQQSFYPNPFDNELIINGFEGRIEIYNSLGELVVQKSVLKGEVINTAEFLTGTYIIKIFSSNTHYHFAKLIKI